MAVTNLMELDPAAKTRIAPRLIGDGVPALADKLVSDVKAYPIGTEYFDKTNRVAYTRVAAAGALADFSKTAAGTLHS